MNSLLDLDSDPDPYYLPKIYRTFQKKSIFYTKLMIYYLITYFVNSRKRSPGSIRILNYLTSPDPDPLFGVTNPQFKNIYGSTTLEYC